MILRRNNLPRVHQYNPEEIDRRLDIAFQDGTIGELGSEGLRRDSPTWDNWPAETADLCVAYARRHAINNQSVDFEPKLIGAFTVANIDDDEVKDEVLTGIKEMLDFTVTSINQNNIDDKFMSHRIPKIYEAKDHLGNVGTASRHRLFPLNNYGFNGYLDSFTADGDTIVGVSSAPAPEKDTPFMVFIRSVLMPKA